MRAMSIDMWAKKQQTNHETHTHICIQEKAMWRQKKNKTVGILSFYDFGRVTQYTNIKPTNNMNTLSLQKCKNDKL